MKHNIVHLEVIGQGTSKNDTSGKKWGLSPWHGHVMDKAFLLRKPGRFNKEYSPFFQLICEKEGE